MILNVYPEPSALTCWGKDRMSLYDKHGPLNPIGSGDVVCESQGHQWKPSIWLEDNQYRDCARCHRFERRIPGDDIHSGYWEVNVIKFTSV